MKRIAFLAAAGMAAAPAHANTGIGLLAMWIPPAIIALIPAILIEAPVLARFLRVSLRSALWMSFIANVASMMVGAAIALASSFILPFATDISREATLAALLPMLLLSWWIENLVVKGMLPAPVKPLAFRATGIANAVTYAAMAVGVAVLVPPASAVFNRFRLVGPINQLAAARTDVSEEFQKTKTMPKPRDLAVNAPNVKGIRLEDGGRLVMTLSFPGSEVADGKHVVYEPRVANGEIVEWRCSSADLAAKYLPAQCR